MISGFHQIELEEETKGIISFSTDKGSYILGWDGMHANKVKFLIIAKW